MTVLIPTSHVNSWREVLEERFGPPISLPAKFGAVPLQFKTEDGVAITTYFKEKKTQSTLLVQGRSTYIKFAQVTLPTLFNDVSAKFKKPVLNNHDKSNKRKLENHPPMSVECDACNVVKKLTKQNF